MKSQTPISTLKSKSKDQLLGNYGMAIGATVLMFILLYSVMTILSGAMSAFIFSGRTGSQGITDEQLAALMSNCHNELMFEILSYIMMFLVYPLIAMISAGYLFICREISYGRRAMASYIFFAFRNHPDKVIIMAIIQYGIQFLLLLPSKIYEYSQGEAILGGKPFLTMIMLEIAGMAIFEIIALALSQCYLIYFDDTEKSAIECLKESWALMKGNKWRLFYMELSFIGYALLIVFSLGIATLWIAPYMEVATVNFYRDLKGEDSVGNYIDVELKDEDIF